jgi:sugar phosphate isomerase/epimerase
MLLQCASLFAQQSIPPAPLAVGYSVPVVSITQEKMNYDKSVGIDFVEVSFAAFIDTNRHLKWSEAEAEEKVKKAKEYADRAGVRIWSVHMPFGKTIDISFTDENKRQDVVRLHKEILRLCRILKPKLILFHPSWYLGLNERALRKSQMIKSANELNEAVKDIGAIMVVENMLGPELRKDEHYERPLCRTVEETVEIMNRLPDDIYSAVDMNHIKNPERLIRTMGRRLRSVHVSDGNGRQENHYLPCNGKGENNWTEILSALEEAHYKGPFIYEARVKDSKVLKPCYDSLYKTFIAAKYGASLQPVLNTDSVLTAKIFPLLSVIENNAAFAKVVHRDRRLQKQAKARRGKINDKLAACESVSCYAGLLQWSDAEIISTGNELVHLYQKKEAWHDLLSQLRKRNVYALYEKDADTALLRHAWYDAAHGINRIFDIYINSEKPRYATIDSISFKRGDAAFKTRVHEMIKGLLQDKNASLFYDLDLDAALAVLQMNGRDEAARYEPLKDGLNQEPFAKINNTDFSKYRYSAILVPGLGPEEPGMYLEPNGAKRCNEAVKRYKKGLAPFIIVSGGHVHPFRTPYNEAVEMKRYLIDSAGIPANVIFIEPHARHTTTNIRNASRMIYHFGLPADKPVLIVTDASQAAYIVGGMTNTAMRDLGYLPYKSIESLSEQEIEFFPSTLSLHTDPFDPLDP